MKNKMNIVELLKNEKAEWKKLGEVCEIRAGSTFPKHEQGREIGKYPFYKVADMNKTMIYMDLADNYIDDDVAKKLKCNPAPKGSIIFPKVGATLSTNKKRILTTDSCFDNNIFALIPNQINAKYLYYVFSRMELLDFANGQSAVPSINKETMTNIMIPVPSIEVQKKIVETLDKFTEYVTELQAELQYRTLQYNYYRDKLLSEKYLDRKQVLSSTSNKIVWKSIKEICTFRRGQSITFKDVVEGNVPVISGGQKPAYYHNVSNRVGKTIAIAGSGVNAGYVSYWEIPVFLNDAFSIEPFSDIDTKYLYYFLQSQQNKIYSFKKGSGVPHVYGEDIGTLKIAIPPLAIQQKVVNILDKFQDILKDTEGLLPTEIEQRQKQYEYYREKLLTFDTGDKTIFTDRQTDRVFNT